MIGPFDIYRHLPKTNCRQCGEKTCMAFASQIIERALHLKDCPFLKGEALSTLINITAPRVRELVFGTVKIGGQDVLYRHEFTYFNEPAIAIEVTDEMNDEELSSKVAHVTNFSHERIGQVLTLQAVAVKNTSQNPEIFAECVRKVAHSTDKSLIFCSFNPPSLKAALQVYDKNPLLYAATRKTWEETGNLALEYECPVVAFADNDLSELKSVVAALQSMGITNIAVDPGTHPENVGVTLSNFVQLRKSAMDNETILTCPIVGVPAAFSDPSKEVMTASMMITRFADLIILHTTDMSALLPVITLRQNIYTDPRKPVSVEPGLKSFGNPAKDSPLLFTTNFALTYYTVSSDIESANLDCYLLVIDTEGLGVEASVAGGQLDALKVRESLAKYTVDPQLTHKRIIIPGLAARISAELEQISGWEVLVGPRDSSGIPVFIKEKWHS